MASRAGGDGWLGGPTRVFVAGHSGMVGGALWRALEEIPGVEPIGVARRELDLRERSAVDAWLAETRPDVVVVAAATVGGIKANNTRPAEFIFDNLAIASNLIDGACRQGIERLLFLGSSCIYPREAAQPMAESELLGGPLEPTNEPYAVAKIAGIKLCESYNRQYGTDYRCLMPTNLYGPGDNFDIEQGHVIPALMHKMHAAKTAGASEITVWGTGRARREFLMVDDLASACLVLMNQPRSRLAPLVEDQRQHLNVGPGEDISIAALAEMIQATVGFGGKLAFDPTAPDGTPRKLLDSGLIRQLGWAPRISLERGLAETYRWFLDQAGRARGAA